MKQAMIGLSIHLSTCTLARHSLPAPLLYIRLNSFREWFSEDSKNIACHSQLLHLFRVFTILSLCKVDDCPLATLGDAVARIPPFLDGRLPFLVETQIINSVPTFTLRPASALSYSHSAQTSAATLVSHQSETHQLREHERGSPRRHHNSPGISQLHRLPRNPHALVFSADGVSRFVTDSSWRFHFPSIDFLLLA